MASNGITPNAHENKSTGSKFEAGGKHCDRLILYSLQTELILQVTHIVTASSVTKGDFGT
jgi:hypothetical protein